VVVPLIVLTTLTVHFIAVVAPPTPGPWPLHWSTTMVEAWAVVGRTNPAMDNALVSSIRAITIARHEPAQVRLGVAMLRAGIVSVFT
jgi:hypothetical protein